MNLSESFSMGGTLFMSIITICGIGVVVFSVQKIIHLYVKNEPKKSGLDMILLFGSLAIVLGFLGQAIGLFLAFTAIEQAGDISPGLVFGGLKVSMIAPLYGTFIFIISLIVWGVLREVYIRKTNAS